MYNQGWKCPNCGKAHGPHVNTCPGISTPSTIPGLVPYEPKYPTYPPVGIASKTNCSKCGIELSAVMGYVCSKNDCPVGLGPAVSFLTENQNNS